MVFVRCCLVFFSKFRFLISLYPLPRLWFSVFYIVLSLYFNDYLIGCVRLAVCVSRVLYVYDTCVIFLFLALLFRVLKSAEMPMNTNVDQIPEISKFEFCNVLLVMCYCLCLACLLRFVGVGCFVFVCFCSFCSLCQTFFKKIFISIYAGFKGVFEICLKYLLTW